MKDHYCELMNAHVRAAGCTLRHGPTLDETTCPTIHALVQQQRDARESAHA